MTAAANPFDENQPTDENYGSGAGIDLSQFDEDFAEAEAHEFEEVPDGKYQVRVDKVALTHTQSSGEPMIRWDLVVISGSQESRHIFKNSVITHKAMPFIKGDLLKLGLELGRLSDLPGHLTELLDKKLEVTLKTKGEYSNCYFNKALDIAAGSDNEPDMPW